MLRPLTIPSHFEIIVYNKQINYDKTTAMSNYFLNFYMYYRGKYETDFRVPPAPRDRSLP